MKNDDEAAKDEVPKETEEEVKKNQPQEKHAAEHYRLAGRPPLITVLVLSIGPIVSQLASALYGILDTIWISKSVGEIGMTAISAYTAFDNIGRAFGFLTSVAGSSQISALFGKGQEEEASQVMCDLIRVCIISGIIVPAILAPLVKHGVRWFGADEEVVELGFKYMFPLLMCTVFTCFFVTSGGFLQGEGRSLLFGVIQVVSLLVNMVILDPLFLLAFKWGLAGAAWARIITEAVPGLLVFTLFFMGKFGVKPKVSQLFKKFNKNTLPSLKVGLSQLVSNLSVSIPGIIVRKLIGSAAHNGIHSFNDVMAGYNVVFRYAQITNNAMIGFTMGYLPAASYSYAAKNFKRWLRLTLHLNWINFLWGTITATLSWAIPAQISLIFAKGDGYLRWASEMLQVGNALGFVVFGRFNFPAMLQSLQLGITSTLLSLASQLVSIIVFALILYYTHKTNPTTTVWCYGLSYAFGLILGGIIILNPVRKMMKGEDFRKPKEEEPKKEEKAIDNEEEADTSSSNPAGDGTEIAEL